MLLTVDKNRKINGKRVVYRILKDEEAIPLGIWL
jgi:hypothetical protein